MLSFECRSYQFIGRHMVNRRHQTDTWNFRAKSVFSASLRRLASRVEDGSGGDVKNPLTSEGHKVYPNTNKRYDSWVRSGITAEAIANSELSQYEKQIAGLVLRRFSVK